MPPRAVACAAHGLLLGSLDGSPSSLNLIPAQPPPASQPKLRLVGAGVALPRTDGAAAAFRREVARENHSARDLSVDDLRDVFAAKVVGALDGGRAAILRPQVRRDLVAAAVTLGMRPFEANLVIALVQDSARRGATGSAAVARAHLVEVRRVPKAPARSVWVWIVMTLVMTVVFLGGLIAITLLL